MKNYTTRYFCHKFCACKKGTRFALRYKTMRECYAALLARKAGDKSDDWAIWTITRDGVMSDRDLRLLSVRYARRVQHLMKDSRSIAALDVAERYANGDATQEELNAAQHAARSAVRDAAWDAWDAAWDAARAAIFAAWDAWGAARVDAYVTLYEARSAARSAAWDAAGDAAWDAEQKAQLKLLAEFGNPFEKAKDE